MRTSVYICFKYIDFTPICLLQCYKNKSYDAGPAGVPDNASLELLAPQVQALLVLLKHLGKMVLLLELVALLYVASGAQGTAGMYCVIT